MIFTKGLIKLIESLYKEEQKLLQKLVESEGKPDKYYQDALKRTITRINEVIKVLDEPSD